MDRPNEDPKPRSSVGRDVEQGAINAAEEHAGGHDPAKKLEAPPGPDSHGVPPRRSTPALPLVSTTLARRGHRRARLRGPASTNLACHGRRTRPPSAELTTLSASVTLTKSHSMEAIIPRWEWRTFGASFGEADRRFGALAPRRA